LPLVEARPGAPVGDAPQRPRRQRKPIGPDVNGLGPDGTPWDPDRRRKRLEERQARTAAPVNEAAPAGVESAPPVSPATEPAEAPKE
jgi:hypothetical protein